MVTIAVSHSTMVIMAIAPLRVMKTPIHLVKKIVVEIVVGWEVC